MRMLIPSVTYLCLCFMKVFVLDPSSVCFSIAAAWLLLCFSKCRCSLLLPCKLEPTALREGVKTLYNIYEFIDFGPLQPFVFALTFVFPRHKLGTKGLSDGQRQIGNLLFTIFVCEAGAFRRHRPNICHHPMSYVYAAVYRCREIVSFFLFTPQISLWSQRKGNFLLFPLKPEQHFPATAIVGGGGNFTHVLKLLIHGILC